MVKSVNELVNSMNVNKKEMTRREKSRAMDKYRKRLRAAEKRMKKRIESGEFKEGKELQSAKRYKKQISKAIEESYSDRKKGYKYSIEHYEETTSAVQYRSKHKLYVQLDKSEEDTVHLFDQARESLDIKHVMEDANVQMRKNLQFQRSLAQSRVEGGISDISNLETTMFYRATQSIWEGENLVNRNAAIMKHFNVTSLEEAFDIVLNDEEVKEELERVKRLSGAVKDTKEVMGGKDKDEEDWKYTSVIIGTVSSRIFSKRQ